MPAYFQQGAPMVGCFRQAATVPGCYLKGATTFSSFQQETSMPMWATCLPPGAHVPAGPTYYLDVVICFPQEAPMPTGNPQGLFMPTYYPQCTILPPGSRIPAGPTYYTGGHLFPSRSTHDLRDPTRRLCAHLLPMGNYLLPKRSTSACWDPRQDPTGSIRAY